jgi:hypothetical protein
MRIASQIEVKWRLFHKDTMGFVSQTSLQVSLCEGLRFAKVVGDLNRFFMRFY